MARKSAQGHITVMRRPKDGKDGLDVPPEVVEKLEADNAKALEAAALAYERAIKMSRHAIHYGEFNRLRKYPFNDVETSIVRYNGVPYLLISDYDKIPITENGESISVTPAPTSAEGNKIWRKMNRESVLYAENIIFDNAVIGDMHLINEEGDNDRIEFLRRYGSDAELTKYMQIGGYLPTESEILSESVQYRTYDLLNGRSYTKTDSGKFSLDSFDSEEHNRRVEYRAKGAVTATAESTPMDGYNPYNPYNPYNNQGGYINQGAVEPTQVWLGAQSSVTTYLRVEVYDGRGGTGNLVYSYNTPKTTVTARTETIVNPSNNRLLDIYDIQEKNFDFAFTIPADKVGYLYSVQTHLVVDGYGRYSVTLTELKQTLPYSDTKSYVGIAKEKVLMFFKRSAYILFNYMSGWIMKLVGNAWFQGNVKISGKLQAQGFAEIWAIGKVTDDYGISPSISGQMQDGTYINNVMSVYMEQEGLYRVSFPSGTLPPNYYIFTTGSYSKNPRFATVISQSTTQFKVLVSDDSSANEGGFNFMIVNGSFNKL